MIKLWSILIGAVLFCLLSFKNDLDRVAAVQVADGGPDRITEGADYYYSDSGLVRNRLQAGKVSEFTTTKPQRTEMEEGLTLTFFDTKGNPGSVLRARRGVILPESKRMEVADQVVFTNAQGERLETERLIWSQDSDRVYTDRPVKITRAQDILYGQGLDANEDFSRYTIRRITGNLYLDKDTLAAPAQR